MTPEKLTLIKELETAFDNLEPQWKQDDSIKECFVGCGKAAVKYHERGKGFFNLDEVVLGIVKKVTERKEAEKKNPSFVLEKEVWSELFKLMESSLHDLHKMRKIKKYDTINLNGYKYENNG